MTDTFVLWTFSAYFHIKPAWCLYFNRAPTDQGNTCMHGKDWVGCYSYTCMAFCRRWSCTHQFTPIQLG